MQTSSVTSPTAPPPAASASPKGIGPSPSPTPAVVRDLVPVGPVGGASYAVYVREGYAFIGSGPRILALDVSDPRAPRAIGQSAPLPVENLMTRPIRDLAGMGPYLVAVTGAERDYDEAVYGNGRAGGVFLIDVSEPSQPRVLSSLYFTQPAWRVDVRGMRAFVANGSGGVRVVDFNNPTTPQELAPFDTPGFTFDVRVSPPYAFIAASGGGLSIVDISLPEGPAEVAFVDTPGRAVALALSDGFAYLADRWGGLRVIDVTDPLNPHETASLDQVDEAIDVAVSGKLAYVIDRNTGLHVLDISDPALPAELSTIELPLMGTTVYPSGDLAFVGGELGGIGVVDVSVPTQPRLAGAVDVPHESSGLAISGSYAILADGLNGLWGLDLSDPTRPSVLSQGSDTANPLDVAFEGRQVFVADARYGLRIYDASQAGSLQAIGEFPMEAGPVSIRVVDETAYLVDESGALVAVDVSQPETPVWLWEYTSPTGRVNDVFILDSYALVADSEIGLLLLDLAQPGGPVEIGRISPPIPPEDPAFILLPESEYAPGAISVFGSGRLAYLISSNGVLWICDLSDPGNPILVGDYRPARRFVGLSADLAVEGNHAYYVYHADEAYQEDSLVYDEVGLAVIDISDPSQPSEVVHFPVFRETLDRDYAFRPASLGVFTAPPYVYVSGWSRELLILQTLAEKRIGPAPSPTPTRLPMATDQGPTRGLESTAAPMSLPPGAKPVEIDTIKMIGPSVGWGIGGPPELRAQRILRTGDGGQTWTDVTPTELLEDGALSETAYPLAFFLDEDSAWVTYGQGFPIPSGARLVWRTTDGGMSWRPGEPLSIVGPEGEASYADYYGPMALVFIDRSTGWLAVNQMTAMMHGDLAILRSTNGGATWEQIFASSTCAFRGLAFLDSNRGYMAEDCAEVVSNSSILDTTVDGGVTWQFLDRPPAASPAPTPDPCNDLCSIRAITASPPGWVSFVLHHEPTASSPRGAEFLYVSSDSGMTWHTSRLPTDFAPDKNTLIMHPSGRGWLLDRDHQTLFVTDDQGANWVPLRTVGWCGKLAFANEDEGWAIAWDCGSGYPEPYPEESQFLLRTHDGGRTWEQLDPHVVP